MQSAKNRTEAILEAQRFAVLSIFVVAKIKRIQNIMVHL